MVFLLVGCIPVEYDYFYMSFKATPDVEVVEYGTADIENLESHDRMPISYHMNRGEYKVFISIDRKSKRPASFISVEGFENSLLTLKGVSISNCGGFDYLTFKDNDFKTLRYEWWGFVKEQCIDSSVNTDEMKIVFRVLDGKTVLAEERLPFQLINNGIYYEYDAP